MTATPTPVEELTDVAAALESALARPGLDPVDRELMAAALHKVLTDSAAVVSAIACGKGFPLDLGGR